MAAPGRDVALCVEEPRIRLEFACGRAPWELAWDMPVYEVAQFEVRPDARVRAERAMHEFANYVRTELPDSTWTTYRDPAKPSHFMAITVFASPAARTRHRSAPGTQAFLAAIEPVLDGAINITDCDLVTSSDLGKRPPARGR